MQKYIHNFGRFRDSEVTRTVCGRSYHLLREILSFNPPRFALQQLRRTLYLLQPCISAENMAILTWTTRNYSSKWFVFLAISCICLDKRDFITSNSSSTQDRLLIDIWCHALANLGLKTLSQKYILPTLPRSE